MSRSHQGNQEEKAFRADGTARAKAQRDKHGVCRSPREVSTASDDAGREKTGAERELGPDQAGPSSEQRNGKALTPAVSLGEQTRGSSLNELGPAPCAVSAREQSSAGGARTSDPSSRPL